MTTIENILEEVFIEEKESHRLYFAEHEEICVDLIRFIKELKAFRTDEDTTRDKIFEFLKKYRKEDKNGRIRPFVTNWEERIVRVVIEYYTRIKKEWQSISKLLMPDIYAYEWFARYYNGYALNRGEEIIQFIENEPTPTPNDILKSIEKEEELFAWPMYKSGKRFVPKNRVLPAKSVYDFLLERNIIPPCGEEYFAYALQWADLSLLHKRSPKAPSFIAAMRMIYTEYFKKGETKDWNSVAWQSCGITNKEAGGTKISSMEEFEKLLKHQR